MANWYVGTTRGAAKSDTSENSSSTAKEIELRVADTVTKREDVLRGLEVLAEKVKEGNWPRA